MRTGSHKQTTVRGGKIRATVEQEIPMELTNEPAGQVLAARPFSVLVAQGTISVTGPR
ncbi:hypothetical protein [Actinophytocola sp.]|jgi:hypothetical protein|uniref:hypothetical protein n=1 Tax=Actinophytocola sp. TaxID=1872138 RepID=UPI002ED985FF